MRLRRVGKPVLQAPELPSYLESLPRVVGRSRVEWALAERLLENPPDTGVDVPAQCLERTSGAMLAWIVLQATRQPGPPPGRLACRPALSGLQAKLFARACCLWPLNPALREAPEQLVEWLKPHPAALGWAGLALAEGGALGLAREAAARWCRSAPPDVELLERYLAHPQLAGFGRGALRRSIALYRRTPPVLERLGLAAFLSGDHREVLECAELLSGRDARVLAVVCLARLGHGAAAIREYELGYLESTEFFPYPSDLVPLLHAPEHAHLRRHLLAHCRVDSPWIELEQGNSAGRWDETVPRWHGLWRPA